LDLKEAKIIYELYMDGVAALEDFICNFDQLNLIREENSKSCSSLENLDTDYKICTLH